MQNKKLMRLMLVLLLDDVIVGIKEKERHDKAVEKVVKQLAKNDLYVKPEKYKWKTEKVGFPGVVTRPGEY